MYDSFCPIHLSSIHLPLHYKVDKIKSSFSANTQISSSIKFLLIAPQLVTKISALISLVMNDIVRVCVYDDNEVLGHGRSINTSIHVYYCIVAFLYFDLKMLTCQIYRCRGTSGTLLTLHFPPYPHPHYPSYKGQPYRNPSWTQNTCVLLLHTCIPASLKTFWPPKYFTYLSPILPLGGTRALLITRLTPKYPSLLITSTQGLSLQYIQEVQEIEYPSFKNWVLMFYFGIWDLNLITWRAYARPLVEKWYLAGLEASENFRRGANIGEQGGQRMVNQLRTGDRQGSTLGAPQAAPRRPTN